MRVRALGGVDPTSPVLGTGPRGICGSRFLAARTRPPPQPERPGDPDASDGGGLDLGPRRGPGVPHGFCGRPLGRPAWGRCGRSHPLDPLEPPPIPFRMEAVTVKELIEAGVHFGCPVSRWNPKMAPYIHGRRNLIHVMDLRETLRGLLRAQNFLYHVAAEGQ